LGILQKHQNLLIIKIGITRIPTTVASIQQQIFLVISIFQIIAHHKVLATMVVQTATVTVEPQMEGAVIKDQAEWIILFRNVKVKLLQ
jgi:hypothetical protein